jgi:hypothetical protein
VHIVPALFGADDGLVGGAERYALELACHMAGETPTTLITFGELTKAWPPISKRIRRSYVTAD